MSQTFKYKEIEVGSSNGWRNDWRPTREEGKIHKCPPIGRYAVNQVGLNQLGLAMTFVIPSKHSITKTNQHIYHADRSLLHPYELLQAHKIVTIIGPHKGDSASFYNFLIS